MAQYLSSLVVVLLCASPLLADNWPAWRGPRGDGHSAETNLPTRWSVDQNVRWKVPLPDAGNSTPVVWQDRIFLTQATEKGRKRSVMCFARADGKLLWQRTTVHTDREPTHENNPYCSASPVTDGERVIASFGSAGMVCYDPDGKELWRKDLGKLHHMFGNASSPVLHKDLAILWCGPGERQYLLAVDKATGRQVWRHDEPRGKFDDPEHADETTGSWATPLIVRVDKHDELVLPLPAKLKAFDPRTGKELWSCDGMGLGAYPMPVYANGIVFAMSGCQGPALAVKAGGRGDVTQTHRLWLTKRHVPQRIGSPVIVGQRVCLLTEQGIPESIELQTGTEFWKVKERVAGRSFGSMVAADGKLYVTTVDGVTLVLAADDKFRVLAKNAIGERVLSSLAVSDGEFFIRSYKHLWCISARKK
jgi:outer membrane protein assembly factor BamB